MIDAVRELVPYSQTLSHNMILDSYFSGHESGSRYAWDRADKDGEPPGYEEDIERSQRRTRPSHRSRHGRLRGHGLRVPKYRQDIIAICLHHDTSDWNQNKTLGCERSSRTPTSGVRCACAPRFCASRAGGRASRVSPPTPGAARRASRGTWTAGRIVAGGARRRLGARQPPAGHRGGEGIPPGEAFRGEDLERAPVGRGALGSLRDPGERGGHPPAPDRDGLLLEAHPLRPLQGTRPRRGARGPRRARVSKKGAFEGEIVLKYLDQSGISLCPAARLLVDEEGAGEPPRGEDPVGQSRTDQPDRYALLGGGDRVASVPDA